MKCALFVDFDNVFTQLRQMQPAAAERFARQPIEWMRWMTESLEAPADPPGPTARRRLLVRRCYLNPNWYQGYRHSFVRAGFEIVDCPPVTSQGKTSTDIHMVLDIVELLAHETRYDEFIVLSADADFTPVLRKLRRYDRRTTVLAIGFPSAAYQASADLLIDERRFVGEALGMALVTAEGSVESSAEPGESLAADASGLPGVGTAGLPGVAPLVARPRAMPAFGVAEAVRPWATASTSAAALAPGSAPPLSTADRQAAMGQLVANMVDLSPVPVPAAALAARLRQHFQLQDQWDGHGSFKLFFRALGLPRLVWINGSGGRIADPERHAVDLAPVADAEPDDTWAGEHGLFAAVREVSGLTGAPLLPPQAVRAVLELLCVDLQNQPYEPTETAKRVRQQCLVQRGLDISLRDVVFMLRGMQLNGHVFGSGHDDVATLARRLHAQVRFLCEREQMVLDAATSTQLRHWIGVDSVA